MNVKMLRKIKRAILKHPRQFEMGSFFHQYLDLPDKSIPASNCGTAGCIAGWAVHLEGGLKKLSATEIIYCMNVQQVWDKAKKILGINNAQASHLFSESRWPAEFRDGYTDTNSPVRRAKVAARYIEYFIKKNK